MRGGRRPHFGRLPPRRQKDGVADHDRTQYRIFRAQKERGRELAGVVVVAGLGTVTRAVAHDSREFLATLPCGVVGVAVVGIPAESATYLYQYCSKQGSEAVSDVVPEAGDMPISATRIAKPLERT